MKNKKWLKAAAILLVVVIALVGCSGKGGSNGGGSKAEQKAADALLKALEGGDANAVQALLAEGSASLSTLFSKASPGGDFAYKLAKDYNISTYDDWENPQSYYEGIVITKYTGNGGVVVVPANIEGFPVTGIGVAAFAKSDIYALNAWGSKKLQEGNDSVITAVILPDTIEYFDNHVFRGRNDMHTINLPSNISYIGDYAFLQCTELFNIIIPDSLTSIYFKDSFVVANFKGCQKLPLRTRARLQELGYKQDF